MPCRKRFGNQGHRHRPAEVVSLNQLTANLPEKSQLVTCFNPFCQSMHAKPLGHGYNACNNIPAALVKVAEELHIQLDQIK